MKTRQGDGTAGSGTAMHRYSVASGINTPAMRILARLLGERKPLFAGNLLLRLVKDLLPFMGPILVGIAVDLLSGTSGSDRNLFGIELSQNSVRSIVIVAIFMAALAVVKAVIGYAHTIVAAHLGRHIVQAARRDLADASMRMALDERRRFNTGDLLDRCLTDSKGLRSFTQNVVIRMISNTVRAVFPVVYMFTIDSVLAVVVLIVIPMQSGSSGLLQRRLHRQTREARAREAEHTSKVKESIDGWNSVASVGGQEWAAQGIHATASASEDAKIIKKHTTAKISAVISLFTAFGIAAVYAIGGWRIISSGLLDGGTTAAEGALTLGTLTAFVGVAKKTYAPFQAYTKIVSSYRTGLVNLERIAQVLEAPMIDPREDGPELQVVNGAIDLHDVSFAYDQGGAPTFQNLSGTIPGHSLTVIAGSSGAGKTTLLRLLMGIDMPTTGTVSIDGQNINKARFASLQRTIALVPQEPMLFTGTIAENLLLGHEGIEPDELADACERAGLIDTVLQLPQGLDTEVGSGKQQLSGGQLRRLAIARALLCQPCILLLDEPTTGLDEANSQLVLDTLRRISDRTTVVMVSHRSEPLRASDHHLILENGGWSTAPPVASADHALRLDTTPALVGSLDAESTGSFSSHARATGTHANGNETSSNGTSSNGTQANPHTNGTSTQADPHTNGTQADPHTNETSSNGTDSNGTQADPHTNGTSSNGTSANSTTGAAPGNLTPLGNPQPDRHTNGTQANPHTNANSTTGAAPANLTPLGNPQPDQRISFTHTPLGPKELARTGADNSIPLTGVESEAAGLRALLVSGHRNGLRPAEDIIPAVLTKLANDRNSSVALAAIENVSPDSGYSTDRCNQDGIQIDTDHFSLRAIETRTLHQAIRTSSADVVVDLAQQISPSDGDDKVHVAIRFVPDDNQQPSPSGMALATSIRRQLDASPFTYRVSLVGATPGSLANEQSVPVVEITALKPPGLRVVNAMIDATVAVYTAAAELTVDQALPKSDLQRL